MTGPPVAKPCVFCDKDCAGVPRWRGPDGRYVCRGCAEARGLLSATAPPPASSPAPSPAPSTKPAEPTADDGTIPVVEEVSQETSQAKHRQCPSCSKLVPGGAVICVMCGFDFRKGFQIGSGVGAEGRAGGASGHRHGRITCPKCQYDLRGLKSKICPECGTDASVRIAPGDKREESKTLMWMYGVPGGMMLAGLMATAALLSWQDSLDLLGMHLIVIAANIVTMYIVYLACGMLWIGFDAPLSLQALRLAALACVTYPVLLLLSMVPVRRTRLFYTPYAIVGIIYAYSLSWLLDIDSEDAWILGACMYGAQLVVSLTLSYVLMP